jgi:hypothetical protein
MTIQMAGFGMTIQMAGHNDLDCIIMRSLALTLGNEVLTKNSAILKSMVGKVSKHWKDIIIEQR